jgi:hypothetical protein
MRSDDSIDFAPLGIADANNRAHTRGNESWQGCFFEIIRIGGPNKAESSMGIDSFSQQNRIDVPALIQEACQRRKRSRSYLGHLIDEAHPSAQHGSNQRRKNVIHFFIRIIAEAHSADQVFSCDIFVPLKNEEFFAV